VSPAPDESDTQQLHAVQSRRVRDEGQRADEAPEPAEARTHARRADKAAYLRDRLREQAASQDDAGRD
jgi:hypothetical protein